MLIGVLKKQTVMSKSPKLRRTCPPRWTTRLLMSAVIDLQLSSLDAILSSMNK